jgi:hypothetical protein
VSDARLTVKVRIQPLALSDHPEIAPAPAPLSRTRIFLALCVIAALLFGAYTLWPSMHGASSSRIETRELAQHELAQEGEEVTVADSAEATPEPVPSTIPATVDASSVQVATQPPSEATVPSPHESPQRDVSSSARSSTASRDASVTDSNAATKAQETTNTLATSAVTDVATAPVKATIVANSAKLPDGFSRIVLTAQMESLQPGQALGPVIPFQTVKRLYLFTEVKGYAGQVLTHRWYYKNQLHTEATLTVEDSPWRTYSENWLLDDQLGDWHVEIVDQAQKLLYRYDFRYQ